MTDATPSSHFQEVHTRFLFPFFFDQWKLSEATALLQAHRFARSEDEASGQPTWQCNPSSGLYQVIIGVYAAEVFHIFTSHDHAELPVFSYPVYVALALIARDGSQFCIRAVTREGIGIALASAAAPPQHTAVRLCLALPYRESNSMNRSRLCLRHNEAQPRQKIEASARKGSAALCGGKPQSKGP
ncbi:MAG TPA: hypothetical protein VN643_00810 [Pyrinomonadaceae bacterium]|nr:hypothetical protein [Pyrinomonadaceae bacterium]